LQRLQASKALHGALSSLKRLMRILRAIVESVTDLLAIGVADLLHRRGIGAKPFGDDLPRSSVLLHDALKKLQHRRLVSLCSDDRSQNLAFMIDGAPEIAELAVDLHERLIQMPTPLRIAAHGRHPLLADLGGEHRAKPVPQNRTVSWLMSIPRSARRSSTLRSDSGYFTYIITTRRMTSGELLKYRNGFPMV
jgi:hypothetical protein